MRYFVIAFLTLLCLEAPKADAAIIRINGRRNVIAVNTGRFAGVAFRRQNIILGRQNIILGRQNVIFPSRQNVIFANGGFQNLVVQRQIYAQPQNIIVQRQIYAPPQNIIVQPQNYVAPQNIQVMPPADPCPQNIVVPQNIVTPRCH
jgi:hypothetical protein